MSTAGKVLTILILLVMIAWVAVLSGVTTTNVNWEQKVAKQEADLQKAKEGVEKAASDVLRLTEAARVQQDDTDRDLREVLGRIAAAERRQSSTIESLTRLRAQVADYQAAVARSQTNLANREAEKAKAEEDLSRKRDEIAKAQALNAELRDQVARLQDEFKRLLAENGAKAADATGANPASTRRPSPAS